MSATPNQTPVAHPEDRAEMTTPQKPKAYQVDHGEGLGKRFVVVFAVSGASARREVASMLDLTRNEVGGCRRAPEFDKFAPGPVPVGVLTARA
ncbi:hypothetical protein [Caballeronia sp. LZ043]|uniref:hypothetical protein n=1 Tax=Caballeronia sp. LZ043 TaxID=3038569 RepID=UPI002855C6EE|nr:hypothetical protein [Caballeronia sp. LZ043]MDR5822546.1 hypothetical protein [Caballeronia sp. LZ043]